MSQRHHVLFTFSIFFVLYVAVFSSFSILQHEGLKTQMNDLGHMDHAIWEASRGNLSMPQVDSKTGEVRSRLTVHANYIFWFIAPLYKVYSSPYLLLILSSLACAFAGLGIFLLSLKKWGVSVWAFIPPMSFWLLPWTQDANLYDFHAITLGAAFAVGVIWAQAEKKVGLSYLFLLLLLMCKEDFALVGLGLGAHWIISGDKKQGWIIVLFSVLFASVSLGYIVPFFSNGEILSGPDGRYAWLGVGAENILIGFFKQPEKVIDHIAKPDHLRLLFLFALIIGPAWKAKTFLLPIIPPVMAALLADFSWMTRITGTYYWVICAAIIVIASLQLSKKTILYTFFVSFFLSIVFSPLPYSLSTSISHFYVNNHLDKVKDLMELVPSEAPLCVQNNLGPHFSQRHYIHSFNGDCNAKYAVFYLKYVAGPNVGVSAKTLPEMLIGRDPKELAEEIMQLLEKPEWGVIAMNEGVYIFEKNSDRKSEDPGMVRRWVKRDIEKFHQASEEAQKAFWPISKYLNYSF